MYNKILKEETDRIVFQYIEEFKNTLTYKKVTIEEYLKDIEIDVEAHESYEYYSLVINNHFKKPLVSDSDVEPNYTAFYQEFYESVKTAFVNELKLMETEYMDEIEENKEDLEYFVNRKYLDELYFKKSEPITEEERDALIKEYKKEIMILEGKVKTIKKALA